MDIRGPWSIRLTEVRLGGLILGGPLKSMSALPPSAFRANLISSRSATKAE
jgi:hypothetical protein